MKRMLVVSAVLALISSASVFADVLTTVRILALSPVEARAVVMDEEDLVRILVPGDSLLNGEYKVRQVLSDRLVLESVTGSQLNTITWLFKPQSEHSDSRVQRFEQEPDEEVVLDVMSTSIELGVETPD